MRVNSKIMRLKVGIDLSLILMIVVMTWHGSLIHNTMDTLRSPIVKMGKLVVKGYFLMAIF